MSADVTATTDVAAGHGVAADAGVAVITDVTPYRQRRGKPAADSSAPALVCALVGICLVRLVTTGAYQRYVRVGMGPILLISGLVLIGAAGVTWWNARHRRHTGADEDPSSDHGHDVHRHGKAQVGWLLLVPVLTVFIVAPPGLGSFALSRSLSATTIQRGAGSFTDLQGSGPVSMLLKEYDERAFDRHGISFAAVPVTVVGFVAKSPGRDGFVVARFQIACCAADGRANLAKVIGYQGTVPPIDTWVEVTGTFEAGAGDQEAPLLRATSLTPIAAPSDPYEPN